VGNETHLTRLTHIRNEMASVRQCGGRRGQGCQTDARPGKDLSIGAKHACDTIGAEELRNESSLVLALLLA
jgi:hypothetical protein